MKLLMDSKFLPFKESFILVIGDLMSKFLNFFGYHKYVKLRSDIIFFNQHGYKPSNQKGMVKVLLCTDLNKEIIIHLRPYTTDRLTFKQVIIQNEYSKICELIEEYNLFI
jgi:hypothetical protein